MNTNTKLTFIIAGLLCSSSGISSAADQEQSQTQTQQQIQLMGQEQKQIYGWELMSVKERAEHREKMLSLKTEQERTAYRQEHHKLMQQRAKEKGVSIPDMPMHRGAEAGSGAGAGTGGGRRN
mgnify:FL=1